jgi:two-component sensor histidine kinase
LKTDTDEIHQLVCRISGISAAPEKNKKDTISRLLAIEKDLIQKNKIGKENEKRISEILKVVMALAQIDYNKKAVISNKMDHIDALALGINMLGEEFQSSTISLLEKEILLKEVHHRVKNNLQIISSLLNLQSKSIKDKDSLEKFEETQNRVRAMALVHEKLYESKESSKINFKEYINAFIEAVNRSYNISEERVSLHTDISIKDSFLKIDTAIPCALILNELVSNCFKHAFPKEKKGNIYLNVSKLKNEYIIEVTDDGIGIIGDMNLKESTSLGLQLVAMLVEQINGDMTILSQKGTTFIIKFKAE